MKSTRCELHSFSTRNDGIITNKRNIDAYGTSAASTHCYQSIVKACYNSHRKPIHYMGETQYFPSLIHLMYIKSQKNNNTRGQPSQHSNIWNTTGNSVSKRSLSSGQMMIIIPVHYPTYLDTSSRMYSLKMLHQVARRYQTEFPLIPSAWKAFGVSLLFGDLQ